MTRTEIEEYIRDMYNTKAEYPWPKYPDNTVFRHESNRKWFALIMRVQKEKLGLPENGVADIINLKSDPLLIGSFLSEKGIFPAYHMNKNHWLSAALDGSADDELIKMLLDMSYEQTKPPIRKRK